MLHLSAKKIRDAFIKGELKASEIVEFFLQRIQRFNPQLGAFLEVFESEAREKARLLDQKKQRKEPLGKLAGIPIALKDNILFKGHLCTCGSKILQNYQAPYSSSVVEALEQEGAIILGKTSLDQFGMGSTNENCAMGPCFNPWDLNCTPGGSSGGSAAAVAARLVPLALGTDTGGSVRQPASFCGCLGFKPTYGRLSRYGVVAFGSSLDQIGPLANFSEDISLLMEVAGKHCPYDATSLPFPPDNYETSNLSFDKMKIGVPYHFVQQLPEETKVLFEQGLSQLKKAGAQLVDISLKLLDSSIAVYYILSTAEASTNLARFDGIRYGYRSSQAKTLKECYERSRDEGFGTEVKRRILLGTFVLSAGYQDAYYKKAQKVRRLIIQEFQKAFEVCDLISFPSSVTPTFPLGTVKDPLTLYKSDCCTISSNLAGLPAISCPLGFSQEGKPMGLQLLGPQLKDVLVLQAAEAFEKLNEAHLQIPPLFNES